MCSIRLQLLKDSSSSVASRSNKTHFAFSFSRSVDCQKFAYSKYISFVEGGTYIRMNASYFLNDPYPLDPRNLRALACVQTPTLLKDTELEEGTGGGGVGLL